MAIKKSPLASAEPWDRVAQGYAAEAGAIMAPFSVRAVELTPLAPNARVLDVAAGPGTLSLAIASRVASVVALDFSEEMNTHLRSAAKARGVSNLCVLRGDGQALPLRDGTFDAAFSMFGWMFFPDRPRGLAELKRVLRPGGSLVVSSWAPLTRAPLMDAMFGALRAADPTMPPPSYDPNSLENPARLTAELREAGFAGVAVHEHSATLTFASVDDFWSRMVRSSAPLLMLRDRLGEQVWAERSQTARAFLLREYGDRPAPLSTTAWLGVARRS